MKYMGSKSRIAKNIVPIIQHYIDSSKAEIFIDMFCGGCNVIDKVKANHRIANDINQYLIGLLRHVSLDGALPNAVSRELYNEVKANIDKFPEWYVGAIGFLASYNGKFFDGGYAVSGYENGRLRNYYKEAKNNILKQNLKGISLKCNSYYKYNMDDINGAVIYCDIPYKGTTTYMSAKAFNYENFYAWVREHSKKNIIIVSENTMPDDFKCIWEQDVIRTKNATKKTKSVEKLFIYNGEESMAKTKTDCI